MKKSLYKALSVFFSIFLLFNLCSCDLFEDFLGKFCGGIGPGRPASEVIINNVTYYVYCSYSDSYICEIPDGEKLQDWQCIFIENGNCEIKNSEENIDIIFYTNNYSDSSLHYKYKLVNGSKEISSLVVDNQVYVKLSD